KTSVFTRKAPYHYGWDWGPRFVTAGIWKPVYVEQIAGAAIDNVQYVQLSQSDSLAKFNARVTIEVSNLLAGRVVLLSDDGNEYGSTADMEFKQGINVVTIPFVIKNPELWWPNGMGKPKPTLYGINAILLDSAKLVCDRSSARLGVREVELIREADSVGESFYFKVNGVPLFMKGANVIPQDVFLPRVTKERQQKLVDVAVESNMNMLRVWGGGIYETDDFYNYCDQQGIFVWQDFIFACGFYPWDEPFYNSVRTEARQNIRRLRNHPSLAIWCGNNEIDEAWHKWGYKEDAKNYPWSDADKANIRKGIDDLFFNEVLPGVLKEEDPTRSYHPSSPLFSWGDPRSQTSGDVHYWGVFHGEEPFSVYKDKPGRFSNEYGHQSFALYDTWKKWFKADELFYLSDAFKVHQKNPKGYRVIKEYMQPEVDIDTTDLRSYIYLSQLIQADGIRVAMEGHRQNRPFTQGSLYWQLNDCWPVTSWSSMDYPYGYKALQFFAINSFAPTILSYNYKDKEGVVELWGITDELAEKTGTYNVSLIDMNGGVLWQTDEQFTIKSNSSVKLDSRPVDELLAGNKAEDVALKLTYKVDGKEMSRIFLFKPYKEVNFAEPKFDVSYKQSGKTVEATITAHTLLKAVLFESEMPQQNPSDAYFDMYPGQTRTITLKFDEEKPLDQLKLNVRTLNSTIKK
ncbi:MAG: glycoside hydrolase family 2 protein, partial [Rikenellaceae bacterium]